MASLGSLSVDVTANLANINRGFDSLDRRLRTFQRTIGRTQGSISTSTIAMGNAYAMMAQVAVRGIKLVIDAMVKLIKVTASALVGAVKLAVTYENQMAQVKTIFGSASSAIKDFANNQARDLGISSSAALSLTTSYGVLISAFAKTKQEAAKMSIALAKQSKIMAAATGRTIADVEDRIKSGLTLTVTAIDNLGVQARASVLQTTKAFKRFAGDKSWGQLAFKVKQQIVFWGILEQSLKVHGLTVKNTTSAALARLSAITEEVNLKIGQAFLPLLQMSLPLLIKMAEFVERLAIKLLAFSNVLFGTSTKTEDASDAQDELASSIDETAKAAAKSLAPFDKLNNLQEKMAEGTAPTPSAGGTAQKDSGLGGIADLGLGKTMTIMIEGLSNAFKDFGLELKILAELAKPILKPLAKSFELFAIGTVGAGTLLIKGFTASLKGLNGIVKLNKGIMKVAFQSLLTLSFDPITQKIKLAFKILRTSLDIIWISIKERMKLKIQEITGLPWDSIKKAIQLKFMTIRTKIKQIWTDIKTSISDKIKQISELKWTDVTNAMEKVWTGIKTKAKSIWDGIKQVVKNATRGIIDIVNGMINVINSVKITSPEVRNPFTGDVLVPARTFGFDISNIDTGFLDDEAPKNKEAVSSTRTSSSGVEKGGGGGSFGDSTQKIEVSVNLDSREIAKGIYDPLKQESQRRGNRMVDDGFAGGGN